MASARMKSLNDFEAGTRSENVQIDTVRRIKPGEYSSASQLSLRQGGQEGDKLDRSLPSIRPRVDYPYGKPASSKAVDSGVDLMKKAQSQK